MSNVLEIIPLGGIGEFGMNCTLLRYGDEMLVLDAGMGFPEESVYGVDICIPDFEILEEYRQEITAIILTHGQRITWRAALCFEEDHVPFTRRTSLSVANASCTSTHSPRCAAASVEPPTLTIVSSRSIHTRFASLSTVFHSRQTQSAKSFHGRLQIVNAVHRRADSLRTLRRLPEACWRCFGFDNATVPANSFGTRGNPGL